MARGRGTLCPVPSPLHPRSSAGSHGNRLRAEEMRHWQIAAAQGCPCGPECSGIHRGIPSPVLPAGIPHPAAVGTIPAGSRESPALVVPAGERDSSAPTA